MNRQGRIACPAHGGGDANVSLWRDNRGRLRAKCWSHDCREGDVLAALGELPSNFTPGIVTDPEKSRANAQRIWDTCRDLAGSPGEIYLCSRGLRGPWPASLRFNWSVPHPSGDKFPALIACVESHDGKFSGVHRTFLRKDGSRISIEPRKAALGPTSGGAVRLAPSFAETIVLAEGIETALSIGQATRLVCWSTLGTSGLKAIRRPDQVHEVIIAADGDEAGERAAREGARRLMSERRTVRIAHAEAGKDFNDYLREKRERAVASGAPQGN